VGFFTRSVADAAVLLSVLAGHDPKDPSASREPVSDYIRSARIARRPPRIGFVRAFYEENTEEQVWSHTEKILSSLKKAGAKITEVEMPPSFAPVQEAHRIIMRAEGATVHQDLFKQHAEKYRPKTQEMIQIGSLVPAVEYLRAQRIKRQFRRDMDQLIRAYDCLLTPTTSSPAPRGLSSTGNAWFQMPWSFSGLPTITIPTGLSVEGLPLGAQLVGEAYLEGKLLSAAAWCERVLDFPTNVLT
jgi:aspartyl-tRNA(Asn)/glutamyl-tRNA(Gln) amidotransferase subunit A